MTRGRRSRPTSTLVESLAARETTLRLCMEAARRRGCMYLACPWMDDKRPEQVIELMVALLEQAPPPRTHWNSDNHLGDR